MSVVLTWVLLTTHLGAGATLHTAVSAGAGEVSGFGGAEFHARAEVYSQNARLRLHLPAWYVARASSFGARVGQRAAVEAGSNLWWLPWRSGIKALTVVEFAEWASSGGAVVMQMGQLSDQHLPHALLVERYASTLDPTNPLSAARAEATLGPLYTTVLVSGFGQAHLLAGAAQLAIGRVVGGPSSLSLTAQGAFDPNAPSLGASRSSSKSGGALSLEWTPIMQPRAALEFFIAAAGMGRGMGGHVGARYEGLGASPDRILTAQLDVFSAQQGYTPGYFNEVYEIDRLSFAALGTPKADMQLVAGSGVRGFFALRWRGLGASAMVVRLPQNLWRVSGHLMWQGEVWSLGVRSVFWNLGRQTRILEDPGRLLAGEFSYRLMRSLFAFATLRQVPRHMQAQNFQAQMDFIAGVGLGD